MPEQEFRTQALRQRRRDIAFPTPQGYGPQQSLQDIPNYEKLSRKERWVMDRLPGLAEGNVGKVLAWFNEGWRGKLLTYLDVGAEALERVTGLGTQWAMAVGDPEHMQEFKENLGAAWYAGSLAADFANMPRFENGRLIIPTDLPGIDGVIAARRQITSLMEQGAEPADALAQARDEIYQGYGALQLRMQLHDAFFHIAGDPINLVARWLRPIDRLNAKVIKKLSLTGLPDDIIQETARLGSMLDEATEIGATAERIGEIQTALKQINDAVALSPWEQTLARLTGNIPFEGDSMFARFLQGRWNPLGLTPKARAAHMAEILTDNTLARIVATAKDDPHKILRGLKRLADGTIGPEFGHMVASHEGRMVRGVVELMLAKAESTMAYWDDIVPERALLNMIGQNLGEDAHVIAARIAQGDGTAIWAQFMESIQRSVPELAEPAMARLDEVLGGFGRTADDFDAIRLERIVAELGDDAILNPQMFVAVITSQIAEAGAEAALLKFGVKARGFLPKMANAVKQAENLAFLRMNPGYVIRNFVNGEFTMLGRGCFGLFGKETVESFWKKMDFFPARLWAGFGPAGIPAEVAEAAGSKAYQNAMNIINDAARGVEIAPDKIARAFRDINLGPADMGKLATKIEAWQGARSFTSGAQEYLARYVVAPKIADTSLSLADELGDGATTLERAVSSCISEDDISKLFFENLNISERQVTTRATEIAGSDIFNALSPDEAQIAATRLAEAGRRGGVTAVWDEYALITASYQHKVEAQLAEQSLDLIAQTINRVDAEPGSIARITGDVIDEFWGAHPRNAIDTAVLAEAAREATPEVAHKIWGRIYSRQESFWGRTFDRIDDNLSAIGDGLKAVEKQTGQKFPFFGEIKSRWGDWRKGWKRYFDWRNDTLNGFFDAKLKGTEYKLAWDQIVSESNKRYGAMVDLEDGLMGQVDNIIATMLPEEQREMFMAGRRVIGDLRRADKDAVIEFRKMIEGLTADQRSAAHNAFIQERLGRWSAIELEEESLLAAMRGSPEQQAKYAQLVANREVIEDIHETILRGHRQGLTAEQSKALDTYRAALPETQELRRLRDQFGDFNDEAVNIQTEAWQQEVVAGSIPIGRAEVEALEGVLVSDEGVNIHALINRWAEFDKGYKQILIDWIEKHPEDVGAIQDFAQWWLREQGFDQVKLYGGKLRMYRTVKAPSLEDIEILPYDSFTTRGNIAGMLEGEILEFEVPIENIFSHFEAHPGFRLFKAEAEFLVNERGLEGARLLSVNMREPTAEQIAILGERLPGVMMPSAEPFEVAALPKFHEVAPRIMPDGVGVDQLYMNRSGPALEAMAQAAEEAVRKPPLKFADLSPGGQTTMRQYIDNVRGWMADTRYQATRYGAYKRDSALLNYNRRFNYNEWLGVLMPYEFWMTQSMWKWALHTIDRPAMMATALRVQKFFNTAFRPEPGLPSRLRGTIRIPVPFMPDWMGGDVFIDPMKTMLPFQQFAMPFDLLRQQEDRDTWAVQRVLEEMLSDGRITDDQYEEAVGTQQGVEWEQATYMARQDDTEERLGGFELMSMLTSPHAPIMWAYNKLRGKPEKIGPFLPITRSIKGVTAMLGIGPAGGLNIEGAIRRELGLPAFDQWDDYRVDRMITNMAADGVITVDESLRGMIERSGPAFEEAVRRAGIEYGVGALGSTLGLPVKAYPTGEEHLRQLKDDYQAAWEAYEKGEEDAIQRFNDEHPEYEARLALFKTPQERLNRFVIDEIWDRYNEMPNLHKHEVSEHLGELFQMAFLNKKTRSYDSIPPEIMQVWLKIIGGDPPGQVQYTETLTPVELTDPEVAWRLQAFYDTREEYFNYNDELWPIQRDYFKIEEGDARKAYRLKYPQLERYWDWRRDFMQRNPQLAPYMEDDPEKWPKFPSEEAMRAAQLQLQPAEWYSYLGPNLYGLLMDYQMGEPLPEVAVDLLDKMGIDVETAIAQIGGQ